MHRLTAKRERFCLEMVKPKANQSKAYRAAFNAHGMKAKTIHEKASRLMAKGKIRARIAVLMKPVIEQVQMTREAWLLEMEKITRGDVRKLFDSLGNPIEIHQLAENEAAIIERFEAVEHFKKVRKADGGTAVVSTGRTRKYKFISKVKALLAFGKVVGWYAETKDVDLGATLEELVLASMKCEVREQRAETDPSLRDLGMNRKPGPSP